MILRGTAITIFVLWMAWITVMVVAAERNAMWACIYASQAAFGNINVAQHECKEGLLPK